jgi:hypothetical protein
MFVASFDMLVEEFATFNEAVEIKMLAFSEIVKEGLGAIEDVIEQRSLYDMGKAWIQGFQDGVRAGFNALVAAVRQQFADLEAFARHILGIASPSRIMREMGEQWTAGFTSGIQDSTSQMIAASQRAMGRMIAATQGMVPASPAYAGGRVMSIDRSRSINVEVNPTYAGYQSEADIYYDVEAALQPIFL